MKQLHTPLPIFKVQVAELKARMMGGAPQASIRLALLTDEGMTVADTSFNSLSEESWDLLRKLCASVEGDYEKILKNRQISQWSDPSESQTGINFEEETNPWGTGQ